MRVDNLYLVVGLSTIDREGANHKETIVMEAMEIRDGNTEKVYGWFEDMSKSPEHQDMVKRLVESTAKQMEPKVDTKGQKR